LVALTELVKPGKWQSGLDQATSLGLKSRFCFGKAPGGETRRLFFGHRQEMRTMASVVD